MTNYDINSDAKWTYQPDAPHSLDAMPKTHRTRLSADTVLRRWSERAGFIRDVPASSEMALPFITAFFGAIAREGEGQTWGSEVQGGFLSLCVRKTKTQCANDGNRESYRKHAGFMSRPYGYQGMGPATMP